jgi:hypothetical protein
VLNVIQNAMRRQRMVIIIRAAKYLCYQKGYVFTRR